jgi:ParB-like chromosome segregation protein Spo0J
MSPRDRIKDFRRVKASTLRPNARNWRTHPPAQQDALRGILAEVGYADALLVRETDDGSLELIDGHLRAETTPDMEVPVLVLDVTAEEAAKLLAVLDPLAEMAAADPARLSDLLSDVETESAALQSLLDKLAERAGNAVAAPFREESLPSLAPAYQLVVDCGDEATQQELYERLTSEGFKCRVLIL